MIDEAFRKETLANAALAEKLNAAFDDVHFQWSPQVSDADDEMVLEAAITGYANAIVTNNARDFAGAAERFSIKVVTPEQMLRKVWK